VIPVEISVNEPICADAVVAIDADHWLRVSTVEDIAAEKLRALLQQTLRNRTRRQDLLDLAVLLRAMPALDRRRIAEFLNRKAAARAVPVSRAAFHDPELAERARVDYDELRGTTRTVFIPADEALGIVLAFVDTLPIPDGP
jgi:predicted nucleotidyltransferase component of viral defense system